MTSRLASGAPALATPGGAVWIVWWGVALALALAARLDPLFGLLLVAYVLLSVALLFARPFLGVFLIVTSTPFEGLLNVPFLDIKAVKIALVALTACCLLLQQGVRARQRRQWRDPYGLLFIVLVLSALISTLAAASPSESALGLAQLVLVFLYYFALSRALETPGAAASILGLVVTVSLPLAVMAFLQSAFGYGGLLGSPAQRLLEARGGFDTAWPGLERAAATFGSNNAAGAFFALVAIIGIARCLIVPQRNFKFAVAATLSGLAVLATFSRGAVLGLACGLLFLIWAAGLRRRRIGLTVLVAAAAALLYFSEGSVVSYLRIGNLESSIQSISPSRFEAWRDSLAMLRERPVTGIGFYAFREDAGVLDNSLQAPIHPHNGFLKALVEQGIVGGVAYLLLIFLFLKTSLATIRSVAHRPPLLWVFASLAAAGVCLFGQELVDAGLTVGASSVAVLFVTFCALQVALMNFSGSGQAAPAEPRGAPVSAEGI